MSTRENRRAFRGLIFPEGTGLVLVLGITASTPHSWYWLRADAPQARRNTPSIRGSISGEKPGLAMTNPVAAEKEEKRAIRIRQSAA
jgi:hypothetical protein